MSTFKALAVATALTSASLVSGVAISYNQRDFELVARQQQDPSTPLFLNSPFCNYFQCAVIWGAGDQAVVNWLNAPEGDVQVDLMTDASSRVAYPIAKAPAISNSCDAGQGYGVAVPGTTCGGFVFKVPSDWSNGNYSMRASHVQQPQLESYTDVILIMNNGTVPNVPFAVVSGSIEGASPSTSAAPASSTGAAPASTGQPSSASKPAATTAPAGSNSSRAPTASPTNAGAANSASSLSSPAVSGLAAVLALGLALLV